MGVGVGGGRQEPAQPGEEGPVGEWRFVVGDGEVSKERRVLGVGVWDGVLEKELSQCAARVDGSRGVVGADDGVAVVVLVWRGMFLRWRDVGEAELRVVDVRVEGDVRSREASREVGSPVFRFRAPLDGPKETAESELECCAKVDEPAGVPAIDVLAPAAKEVRRDGEALTSLDGKMKVSVLRQAESRGMVLPSAISTPRMILCLVRAIETYWATVDDALNLGRR